MKHWLFAIKLTVTTVLLGVLLYRVDLSTALVIVSTSSGLMLLSSAVAVLLMQSLVAAARFVLILPFFGARCDFTTSLRVWMIGLFVTQTPLTFIAGDAMRVLELTLLGTRVRTTVLAVLLERALGFLVILLMVLLCVPWIMSAAVTSEQRHIIWTLTTISGAAAVAFAFWPLLPRVIGLFPVTWQRFRAVRAATESALLLHRPLILWRRTVLVALLSLVMHVANIFAIFLIMGYFGARPDFLHVVAVVAPAMLLMLLPISFAGWGVREGAMAAGLSLLGIPADRAVAISIAFGLALLIASIPGAFLLIASRRRKSVWASSPRDSDAAMSGATLRQPTSVTHHDS